jgi:hypothetical protein
MTTYDDLLRRGIKKTGPIEFEGFYDDTAGTFTGKSMRVTVPCSRSTMESWMRGGQDMTFSITGSTGVYEVEIVGLRGDSESCEMFLEIGKLKP